MRFTKNAIDVLEYDSNTGDRSDSQQVVVISPTGNITPARNQEPSSLMGHQAISEFIPNGAILSAIPEVYTTLKTMFGKLSYEGSDTTVIRDIYSDLVSTQGYEGSYADFLSMLEHLLANLELLEIEKTDSASDEDLKNNIKLFKQLVDAAASE